MMEDSLLPKRIHHKCRDTCKDKQMIEFQVCYVYSYGST